MHRYYRMRDGARLLYTLVLRQRKSNHPVYQPGSTITPSTLGIIGHVCTMQNFVNTGKDRVLIHRSQARLGMRYLFGGCAGGGWWGRDQ
jgi:hypothetical protein